MISSLEWLKQTRFDTAQKQQQNITIFPACQNQSGDE